MVSRSLEAGNTIMPPTDSITNGKSSVWAAPARCASRSASLPGTAEACGVKESRPPPTVTATFALAAFTAPVAAPVRSAMKMTASIATNSTVPCRNSAVGSIATAPSTAGRPAQIVSATRSTATNAATKPANVSVTCAPYRSRLGTNASTRTPATATPKTMSIGLSRKYSMLGVGRVIGAILRLGRPS